MRTSAYIISLMLFAATSLRTTKRAALTAGYTGSSIMASFGATEVLVVVFFILFFALASYFLVDAKLENRTVVLNYSKGIKNIVKAVNGTTSSTLGLVTTTTISKKPADLPLNVYLFGTGGVPSMVLNKGNETVVVNCGKDVTLTNKLFMNGLTNIRTVAVSRVDENHIGECGHLFTLFPPQMILDTGQVLPYDYYSNYKLLGMGRIMTLGSGKTFVMNDVSASIINYVNDSSSIMFRYRNNVFVYSEGCDTACVTKSIPANSSMGVIVFAGGGEMDESVMSTMLPLVVVKSNVSSEMASIGMKYGIKVVDLSKGGDIVVILDGKSVSYVKPKGL
jgi:hypothetical protein